MKSPRISEHSQSSAGPGRVHPGVFAADGLTPLPLTSACTCLFRNQGRPFPTSKSTTSCLLYQSLPMWDIYFAPARGLLHMWGTFLFALPCGTHALFVLNKLQICKYNACFVPLCLQHYQRTFAPSLAKRGKRYNICNSSDGRGKKI